VPFVLIPPRRNRAGYPGRALQHALYRAAKADPGRRFHPLYDKVSRSDVLIRISYGDRAEVWTDPNASECLTGAYGSGSCGASSAVHVVAPSGRLARDTGTSDRTSRQVGAGY
jgi:hypothetical protein